MQIPLICIEREVIIISPYLYGCSLYFGKDLRKKTNTTLCRCSHRDRKKKIIPSTSSFLYSFPRTGTTLRFFFLYLYFIRFLLDLGLRGVGEVVVVMEG